MMAVLDRHCSSVGVVCSVVRSHMSFGRSFERYLSEPPVSYSQVMMRSLSEGTHQFNDITPSHEEVVEVLTRKPFGGRQVPVLCQSRRWGP